MDHISYVAPLTDELTLPATSNENCSEALEAVQAVNEIQKTNGSEFVSSTIDHQHVNELINNIEKLAEENSANCIPDEGIDESGESIGILNDEKIQSKHIIDDRFDENYPQIFSAFSAQDAHNIINNYGEDTYSSFVSMRKMKRYGVTDAGLDMDQKNYRVFFEGPDIKFDGIPYVHVADKMYICHLGKDKTETTRMKIRNQSMERRLKLGLPAKDLPVCRIRSKKINCPVKISVKMIAKFPQFKIDRRSKRVCESSSKKLREAMIQSNGNINCYYQFIGTLPKPSNHNHSLGENCEHEPIDNQIKEKIIQLTWQGMTNAMDIKQHLEDYVENELFAGKETPSKDRRRYYPNQKDIRNYMTKARVLGRVTPEIKVELDGLLEKLRQNRPTEDFLIQMPAGVKSPSKNTSEKSADESNPENSKTTEEKQTLVFCHQTTQQKRLMRRYESLAYISNINHLSERAPFPTFCLFVQTNVDFQPVALFTIETSNIASISQGLQTLKEWNPNWCPKYFMIDHSDELSESLKQLFPNSGQFWCETYQYRTWKSWLMNEDNHLTNHCKELIKLFQDISKAYNEESLQTAALNLQESLVWKSHAQLRTWFNAYWLVEAKKWVVGYHPEDLYILKSNEKYTLQNDVNLILNTHIGYTGAKKLCMFIEKLVENIMPHFYQRYVDLNRQSYCEALTLQKKYGNLIPMPLSNRPASFIKHFLQQMQLADKKSFSVAHVQPGIFFVHEKTSHVVNKTSDVNGKDTAYTVSFGSVELQPSCDCQEWHINRLPCVHFCSVFISYPDWSFDMLAPSYTSLPQLNLDYSCVRTLLGNCSSLTVENNIKTVEIQTLNNPSTVSSQGDMETNLSRHQSTAVTSSINSEKTNESPEILEFEASEIVSDNKKLNDKSYHPPVKQMKLDFKNSTSPSALDKLYGVSDTDDIDLVLDLGEDGPENEI